jgi:hypothetical protein
MSLSRRRFLKAGAAGSASMMLGASLGLLPRHVLSAPSPGTGVITISFSGTACTRDEGEASRAESNKGMYLPATGYIPVRINKELGGDTPQYGTLTGHTVRGVGENDWAHPRNQSEPLWLNGPLNAPDSLRAYAHGDQRTHLQQYTGYSMAALALHGANLAAASGAGTINFIGHSRGACECIMAAWFLFAYGNEAVRNARVNIFAIDPVPGSGTWYGLLTQLPPNVTNYVGVYSWDEVDGLNHSGHLFQALVPRPNGLMRNESNSITLKYVEPVPPPPNWWHFFGDAYAWYLLQFHHDWGVLADDAQQLDPLLPSDFRQPRGYKLYACRGKHSTVSGNATADGRYDPNNISQRVAPVPALIYKMARAYLTEWGTTFTTPCAVAESVQELRKKIHRNHRGFDKMGGGETRDSSIPLKPYVRRVSSISGINPSNNYFMDDVVGDPPYKLAFPVTTTHRREKPGWVKWNFL